MPAIDALLVEFDQEMAATRELLARLPDPALAWKPHEKSFTLGALAAHLAQLPEWGRQILESDGYELKASAGPWQPESRAAILEVFDRHVAGMRQELVRRSDAELSAPWTLREKGQTLLTLPKVSALRRFLIHHVIHHRGQLSVYLRLQDVPLPPLYGTTADHRS